MKLVGMMPVRNEDWCLALSLSVALLWCDEVVVLLHACTDRSRDIAFEIAQESNRLYIISDDADKWCEMTHRQFMLENARQRGATHLAIIDADEVLTANLLQWTEGERRPITQAIHDMPQGSILELPGYNLRDPYAPGQYGEKLRPRNVGLHHFHNNGVWGNRWFSTAFADQPCLAWWGDTFHQREPRCRIRPSDKLRSYRPIQQGQGGVMHLWGASERRLIAKHALYKVTERLRWPDTSVHGIDTQYSWAIHGDANVHGGSLAYGNPSTWTYSPVPESWWAPYAHLMKYLDVNAEPWQEAEVRRLVAQHGRDKFTGLDLFGVA